MLPCIIFYINLKKYFGLNLVPQVGFTPTIFSFNRERDFIFTTETRLVGRGGLSPPTFGFNTAALIVKLSPRMTGTVNTEIIILVGFMTGIEPVYKPKYPSLSPSQNLLYSSYISLYIFYINFLH